jgi:hypothetical protein
MGIRTSCDGHCIIIRAGDPFPSSPGFRRRIEEELKLKEVFEAAIKVVLHPEKGI